MTREFKTPRVMMDPAARRGALLDAAQALFFERGYENTTINAIMEKAGVSKGGLYHHFASKEDILEALAARLSQESVARLENVFDEPGLDGLGRLNTFFARARRMKIEDAPRTRATFDVLFKPENIVLYHRINAAVLPVVVPLLARIIAQGKSEGVFNVPDPVAAAEVVLQLGTSAYDLMARAIAVAGTPEAEAVWEEFEQRLIFHGIAIDRILGLPDGSLVYVEPGFVRAVMAVR
ncbi:TetR/AcrR family transcriptional regulator [Phreatobacter stygius]|uniref:TetR/AcrR family transcriptional regulator n=1 Tax=Phreatobacter stygius TaxID=1940610 RepID=A0A4D7BD83_9HYPH|nr:TetR/AcrR family transcriptional regulator [Phreatobacter stygius]QCI68820.1 TetR/AcrR family transcriptional regulator [Phreatobacter stygius]